MRKRHVRLYGEMEDLMGQEIDVAIIHEVTDPLRRMRDRVLVERIKALKNVTTR